MYKLKSFAIAGGRSGFLTWQGVPANGRLLGSVTPGRGPLRPPPPPDIPVTKLRVEAPDASR